MKKRQLTDDSSQLIETLEFSNEDFKGTLLKMLQ